MIKLEGIFDEERIIDEIVQDRKRKFFDKLRVFHDDKIESVTSLQSDGQPITVAEFEKDVEFFFDLQDFHSGLKML